jgi:hypothetical protein
MEKPKYNRESLVHMLRLQARAINSIADAVENGLIDVDEAAKKLTVIDNAVKGRHQ